MENGEWKIGSGKWEMENGKCKIESVRCDLGHATCKMQDENKMKTSVDCSVPVGKTGSENTRQCKCERCSRILNFPRAPF